MTRQLRASLARAGAWVGARAVARIGSNVNLVELPEAFVIVVADAVKSCAIDYLTRVLTSPLDGEAGMDAAELVVRISSIVEGQVGVLAERLGKTAKALVESFEVKDVLYRAALEPALDAFATKLFDERAGVFLPGFVRLATTAVEALGLNRLIIFASACKLGPCRLYTGVDGQRHSRFSNAFWSELEANPELTQGELKRRLEDGAVAGHGEWFDTQVWLTAENEGVGQASFLALSAAARASLASLRTGWEPRVEALAQAPGDPSQAESRCAAGAGDDRQDDLAPGIDEGQRETAPWMDEGRSERVPGADEEQLVRHGRSAGVSLQGEDVKRLSPFCGEAGAQLEPLTEAEFDEIVEVMVKVFRLQREVSEPQEVSRESMMEVVATLEHLGRSPKGFWGPLSILAAHVQAQTRCESGPHRLLSCAIGLVLCGRGARDACGGASSG
jgi:hypothetical protein